MKVSNIKFHENPSHGCKMINMDGWPDLMRLTGAFCEYASMPKGHCHTKIPVKVL
jgi:hypothetical protein